MVEATSEGGLRVLGVTGGVGSGKSTAAKLLANALGARLLDADQIVQELLTSTEVLSSIELAVGFSVRAEDGSLDRALLSERVFDSEEAREALEGVLHPAVRNRLWFGLAEAEQAAAPNPATASSTQFAGWAVLDVPLLREGGLDAVCDFIVHIEVPAGLRCARACARHGWTADTWEAREAAQMNVDEKRSRADAILVNDAEPELLPERVAALLPQLRDLPPRPLRARWPAPDAEPTRQNLS